jgi:DNA (cytosine-5)-methyltransferase 1
VGVRGRHGAAGAADRSSSTEVLSQTTHHVGVPIRVSSDLAPENGIIPRNDMSQQSSPPPSPAEAATGLRFADLFCGIGGFHAALHYDPLVAGECVFASDIDPACRSVYDRNFAFQADGDIWPIARDRADEIPAHDILCAGFPCQPFSKSGHQKGISEARGTLFEAILLILKAKRPRLVLLENVRNLVGPRHTDTWATIIRLLRDLGYAVSSEPTLLSPHHLPEPLGSPQARERVFIPAVHVGRDLARRFAASLPPLVDRRPRPDWAPSSWRVMDYLERWAPLPDRAYLPVKPLKVAAIDMWQDLLRRLDVAVPRFPLWTDVFLGRLQEGSGHPKWKNALIAKNRQFYEANREVIDAWVSSNRVANVLPSYRKFEWQVPGDGDRDIWRNAIQFRPSGVRVRPLTYLPALVAINQTSIVGPWRRTITPIEAACLQGFGAELLGGRSFDPHPDDTLAFQQLGNAVHVGTTRFIARLLLLLGEDGSEPNVPAAWHEAIQLSEVADRSPEALSRDDESPE